SVLAERLGALGTENAFKLGDDIQRCLDRGMDVIRFNLGAPDFRSAPHLNQVAIEALEAGRSGYCDPAGIPAFRESIAAHVRRTRGVDMTPDRIVVTAGAKPPIGYTFQTYVDPGDEVVYPSPGFPIYESWATYVGADPKPLHLSEASGFAFTADDLAERVSPRTKLVIICSPSNPTGGVLDREELGRISEVILTRCHPDVRVYSDEIYEWILFDGLTHASIASCPGMDQHTIIASGHSKGFAMTGWRLGWAALPTPEEAGVFKTLNINTISCVPPFLQEAGCAAYDDPRSLDQVRHMVAAFQQRRDWIVPALNAIDGVSCQCPGGAFYVFPNVGGLCRNLGVFEAHEGLSADRKDRVSPSHMLQMFLLYRYGIATMDRASFGTIGARDQHFLRLSIANSMEEIKKGIGRLDDASRDREGFLTFAADSPPWSEVA
ncbi:MAG: aminotransferase class I/II-fold pyridoxal phosphate-dependent enzyme, partial [Gemmatimonadota bacterium]|nr:aminotransferase class I/II-fold pyridoxal phosphate-dependent enzyme [Gemmatimonadota bacterium]